MARGQAALRARARANFRTYAVQRNARVDQLVRITPQGHRVRSFTVRDNTTDAAIQLPRRQFAQFLFGYGGGSHSTIDFAGGRVQEQRTISSSVFDNVHTTQGVTTVVSQQLNRLENRQSSTDGYAGALFDDLNNPLSLDTSHFSFVAPSAVGGPASSERPGLLGIPGSVPLLRIANYAIDPFENCWVAMARFLGLPIEEPHNKLFWEWEEGVKWFDDMLALYNDRNYTGLHAVYLDPNRVMQAPGISRNEYMVELLSGGGQYVAPLVWRKTVYRRVVPEVVGKWPLDAVFVARWADHVHLVELDEGVHQEYVSPAVNPIGYMDPSGKLYVHHVKNDPSVIPPLPNTPMNIMKNTWSEDLNPRWLRHAALDTWKAIYNLPPKTKLDLVQDPTSALMKDAETAYLFYDVETIVDGRLQVYSVAYLFVPQSELDATVFDEHEWKPRVKLITGHDCMLEFVRVLSRAIKQERWRRIYVTGFNSARFDNYFLLEGFNECNAAMIHHVFFQRTALLSADIRAFNSVTKSMTQCALLDVAKLLPAASLDSLGKSFRTTFQKVAGFSHDEVQGLYSRWGWAFLQLPGFLPKLKEYNVNDVLVLAGLLRRYRATLRELIPDSFRAMKDDMPTTLGGLSRRHWELDMLEVVPSVLPLDVRKKTDGRIIDTLTSDQYRSLRMGTLGGRCSLIHGPVECSFPTVVLDAASLYPTVMAVWDQAVYPAGVSSVVTSFDPSLLGVYRCHVSQSHLRNSNLINLVARKEFLASGAPFRNNWDAEDVYDVWLTTPEYQLLVDNGCNVTVQEGLVWSHRIRGCELFRCLLTFMKVKKEQDRCKEAGEPFNPALRALCKYLMNSLYGQMLKRLYTNSTMSVTPFELDTMYDKVRDGTYEYVKSIKVMAGEVYVSVLRTVESVIHKQSPFILGAYVLGLSRTYMARHLWLRVPRASIFYIDTDCGHITREAIGKLYEKHRDEKVAVFPEVLEFDPDYANARLYRDNFTDSAAPRLNVIGCFTDDTPKDAHGIIFGGKKLYAFRRMDGSSSTDEGGHCIAVKGVSGHDIFLSESMAMKFIAMPRLAGQAAMREFYLGAEAVQKISSTGVAMMRQLLAVGRAYALCRQLRTVGSGVHESRSDEFGQLFEVFSVKRISRDGLSATPSGVFSAGPASFSREQIRAMFAETFGRDAQVDDADVGHDVYFEPEVAVQVMTSEE